MYLKGKSVLDKSIEVKPIKDEFEGRIFQHFKGNYYCIKTITVFQSAHNPHMDGNLLVAVYHDINGNTYTRPLSEFFDRVLHRGEFVDRFTMEKRDFSW